MGPQDFRPGQGKHRHHRGLPAPNLAAGVLIVIFGILAFDFLGDLIIRVGKEQGIEWIDIFGEVFKVFIYFVVLMMGLRVMKMEPA